MNHFLTFDLGTTLYKIALFDAAGNLLGIERVSPPIEKISDGRCELDPMRFTQSLAAGAQRLAARVGGLHNVLGVSFATQANSFTLLDEHDRPIIPLILWPDRRAEYRDSDWQKVAMLAEHRRITGVPRLGPLMAMAKFIAMRNQDQSLEKRAHRLCFISDYFTHWMTGQWTTEASVAGLSGIADVRALRWWPPAIAALELRDGFLPPIVRAATDIGRVLSVRAQQLGLPASSRFVIGCLDQYAGAIGTGTLSPGRVCETTGTVLSAVRCVGEMRDDVSAGVFQGPGFAPDRFFQMSFSSTAANLLQWYRDQLPGKPSFDALTALAASANDDVIIEPADANGSIAGSFRQVKPAHTPGQVVRGIMRCVAGALADQISNLCGANRPAEIHSAGGAARNDLWLQIKADTLKIPMVAMACEEPTSLGAAMLAAKGVGIADLQTAGGSIAIRKRFEPGR